MRYAIAMFTAAAAMFIAIGANSVLQQQRAITDARPVQGTITSSEVRELTSTDTKNRRTTIYRPAIRYHYPFGGAIMGSGKVFPVSDDTSLRRAKEIVAAYPPGKAVTVWCNPQNPMDCFLIREWDFSPYLVMLCAMTFLSTGLGLWAAAPWRRERIMPLKTAAGGWHEIPIRQTLAAQRRPWRAVSLVWYVIGAVIAGHYFVHAERPYELTAMIAAPLYAALGLVPLVMYARRLRQARAYRDARVTVNTDAFWLGKTFNAKVEQAFKQAAHVDLLRVGLTCEKVEYRRTRNQKAAASAGEQFESWEEAAADQDVAAGKPLQVKARFTPPKDQPATTTDGHAKPSRYQWQIVVETKIAKRQDYRGVFPIVVES